MRAVDLLDRTALILSGVTNFVDEKSGTITAVATIVLAVLTLVLARATHAMAAATSTANVIASLETNQWSWMHLDLVVQNTGNAPAYDVKVKFDPPLPYMTKHEANETPFGTISIIRPGHSLTTNVNDFQSVKQDVYRVTVQWKKTPKSSGHESNSYDINIAALGAISRLGAASPGVQIAEQVKKMREDWRAVALGQRRLKVDEFSQADRNHEHERIRKMREERREGHPPVEGQEGPIDGG